MSSYDTERMNAAFEEMDQLTATFRQAEEALEEARKELQKGIVRHLSERNAPPGKLAEHSPYDRNHVGRIAKAAGIPPLRGRKN